MAHGEFLRQHSEDPKLASHVMHDYRNGNWAPKTRAMLDYASKPTCQSQSVTKADFDGLKEQGAHRGRDTVTVLITCTFAFMTRLADGLGVEPAEGRQEWVEEWLQGPARDQEWLLNPKS